MDMPEIPDFLKVENRKPGAGPDVATRRVRARREPRRNWNLPRTMDATALELLRQIEAVKKAKTKVRLAALREKKSAARKS
jgi:hypothetical protein